MAGINIRGIELLGSATKHFSIPYLNVNLIFVRCLKKKRGCGDGVMTTELIHILCKNTRTN
jgi:hypothetical protein